MDNKRTADQAFGAAQSTAMVAVTGQSSAAGGSNVAISDAQRKEMVQALLANPKLAKLTGNFGEKKQRRIDLPQRGPNWFALIVGKGGEKKDAMEKASKCKIFLRGQQYGQNSYGGRGDHAMRGEHRVAQGDDFDKLHVMVEANTEEDLEAGCKLIQDIVKPPEEHKAIVRAERQTNAALWGACKELEECAMCGQTGHKHWNCPNRTGAKWKMSGVKCTICGDGGHSNKDCTKSRNNVVELYPGQHAKERANTGLLAATNTMKKKVDKKARESDNEYGAFLAELEGRGTIATAGSSAKKAAEQKKAAEDPDYAAFLAAMGQ